jgi:GT2 family glycosyltransferase
MDRWSDIAAGMAALRGQTTPPLETILVVDGNPGLLERATTAFPDVRVVPNDHRQGVSGARNTGLAVAAGDVIAFLDDDACPEPDWIHRLGRPYADPAVMAVGGLALPVWPETRPDHLVPELDWIVGCTYRGHPTDQADVRNLFGCNMSVRRAAVDLNGGFDEDIGRIGLTPLGCDDTEYFIRLRQRVPGARVVYEPTAIVHHRVTPARTTWAYLRSRSLAEGLSKARVAQVVGASDATSVESEYVRRVLSAALLRELRRAVRGDSAGWRGSAGVVTSLGAAAAGYVRGRFAA